MTRRDFLGLGVSAAGLLAAGGLRAQGGQKARIERVQAFPVRYRTVGRFKFFEDSFQGRPVGRPTVVVKITTGDGLVGWGQSVPTPKWSYETLETVQTTIERYIAPAVQGLDAFDVDAVHAAMDRIIAPSFSTGQPICKAGIDLALWDLRGRALGKSIPEVWGLRPGGAVTLSWTLNPRTLDDVPGLIEEGRRRGYSHFNVKVAPDVDFDVRMCRMVKELAPDGFLWADANGGYTLEAALKAIPRLAEAGVAVLEQPLPANRLTGYREVMRRRPREMPVLMDEGVVSVDDLQEFLKLGLLDGVAMRPARCGGLTAAKRQIEMLRAAGKMWLGSGLTDPDLSLAASLQLYGAFGYRRPAALNGPQFLEGSILKQPLAVRSGCLSVPSGPGLGVEVDEERLAEQTGESR